jgi:hypothetical protein
MILKSIKKICQLILILPIRAYQYIHPSFFRGTCRFYPTCSHYAIEAIETHGALKGFYLAIFRIIRCNPFCKGGYDPVPPRKESL